jgi:hypothetical protein
VDVKRKDTGRRTIGLRTTTGDVTIVEIPLIYGTGAQSCNDLLKKTLIHR